MGKQSAKSSSSLTSSSSEPSSSTSHAKNKNHHKNDSLTSLLTQIWLALAVYLIFYLISIAYKIRMSAIDEYGAVIHEFDPYFNYRATEYLYAHGSKAFFEWFDSMSWYPLGRPVGTTIYPGMQFTAVWIKRYILTSWSLNDVCCYIPTWFGAMASVLVGLIAYEASIPENTSSHIIQWLWDLIQGGGGGGRGANNSANDQQLAPATTARPAVLFGLSSPSVECGIMALAMMAIVPAHLMRSVGGGYDNESIAVTAMVATFYLWMRSLRNEQSAYLGALTAVAYFYMVAAWGGYIFVINLIGLHAAALVGAGRFSKKLYISYSLFYVIGTALAVQVPVVGWQPLKSLEQLGPCAIFIGFQLLQVCEHLKGKRDMTRKEMMELRMKVFGGAFGVVMVLVLVVAPSGYFGPLSSRVRGLFVQHTKTGNPLVDSVAEHQAASTKAYFKYLHHVCSLTPIGYIMVMANLSDSSSFLLVWGSTAYYFSHKMVRLVLLTAPIGCSLGGIAAGRILVWCFRQWWESTSGDDSSNNSQSSDDPVANARKAKKNRRLQQGSRSSSNNTDSFSSFNVAVDAALSSSEGVMATRGLAILFLLLGYILASNFTSYCWRLSGDLSNPTIIMKARLRDGRVIKVDDYREAYWWLRDNSPEDSRIMAWWDYGYQITAIANRTTLADGNTWNHEHIALLGRALTTSEEEGYQIARHLADYVLVWCGGGGDDLAKSPHLARIANSVYRSHCPEGDPTCRSFSFINREGTPSPMMERSMLYRLHGSGLKEGVTADPEKWKEVFRSKYGKVRIYKILDVDEESKAWVDSNLLCDVEGGWFCPGQYPPGLSTILSEKQDFAQLEDFNREENDEEYQKMYHEALRNPQEAALKARKLDMERMKDQQVNENGEPVESSKKVDEIYNTWEDTDDTTRMWNLISNNQLEALNRWLQIDPAAAFIRSKDGRGPMWWAFEQRNEEVTKILMKAGVPHTDRDSNGLSPVDLLEGK